MCIRDRVDLDLSLEKGASLPCPLLHDGDEVSFLASAETVDGAIHASTGYMHDFLLAKTSLNAVSYTHLAVYKRQGISDSGVGRGSELESSATAGDSPVLETEKDAAGT